VSDHWHIFALPESICSSDEVAGTTTNAPASVSSTSSSASITSSAIAAQPSHRSTFPIPAIVGLAVGVQAVLVLSLILCWLRRERRRLGISDTSDTSHRLKLSNKSKDLRSGFIAPFHAADYSAPTKLASVLSHPQVQSFVPANDSTMDVDVPLPPYETEERPSTPTAVHRPAGREDPRFKG
jgi:hypothetical protein